MDEPGTAIVTGAGKRVGETIARSLLESGWKVIAHVRRDSDEAPDGAVKVAAELADINVARQIFDAAHGLPPVRMLVNNASRFAWDSLADFDAGEFDAHMHVNVRAPLLLSAELARSHAGGDALIVNVLDAKLAAPNPDFLSYTVSKQALAGFTELGARALAGRGIRMNGIAPALMLRSPGQSEANFDRMHRRNPLGRGVTPGDVAKSVAYLWSCKTITGDVLTLDGGLRFAPPARDVQFLED